MRPAASAVSRLQLGGYPVLVCVSALALSTEWCIRRGIQFGWPGALLCAPLQVTLCEGTCFCGRLSARALALWVGDSP